jgi:hypothetical protein
MNEYHFVCVKKTYFRLQSVDESSPFNDVNLKDIVNMMNDEVLGLDNQVDIQGRNNQGNGAIRVAIKTEI